MQFKKNPILVNPAEKEMLRSIFKDTESLGLLTLILASSVILMGIGLLLAMPVP